MCVCSASLVFVRVYTVLLVFSFFFVVVVNVITTEVTYEVVGDNNIV